MLCLTGVHAHHHAYNYALVSPVRRSVSLALFVWDEVEIIVIGDGDAC